MRPIIIDTMGMLDHFQHVRHMFEFYPNGFRGIVADAIVHRNQRQFYDEIGDEEFLQRVQAKYYESPEYVVHSTISEGHALEDAMSMFIVLIYHCARDFVLYHQTILNQCKVDIDSIELGSALEYIALERR